MIGQIAPPSCSRCRYASAFGNCGEPVAAGLATHFQIVRHARDGYDCPAFVPVEPPAPPPTAIERRAERMHRMGLLDAGDLRAVRVGQHADPAGWSRLLDACWSAW